MIGANPETAKRIASQLRVRSKAFTFPTGTEALCNQLLETVDSTTFPGALVPEQAADGEFLVVAIALPSDWRRLCPVLRAFAGPTLTSFDGLPGGRMVKVLAVSRRHLAGSYGSASTAPWAVHVPGVSAMTS